MSAGRRWNAGMNLKQFTKFTNFLTYWPFPVVSWKVCESFSLSASVLKSITNKKGKEGKAMGWIICQTDKSTMKLQNQTHKLKCLEFFSPENCILYVTAIFIKNLNHRRASQLRKITKTDKELMHYLTHPYCFQRK